MRENNKHKRGNFAVNLKEYLYLFVLLNIYLLCPIQWLIVPRGTMGQFFRHENFIILKVVKEIGTTNWYQ